MDNNAIDQILSAINGASDDKEDMAVFMRDLPHRVPSVRTADTALKETASQSNGNVIKSNANRLIVNRPSDPVGSISSAENISSDSDNAPNVIPSEFKSRHQLNNQSEKSLQTKVKTIQSNKSNKNKVTNMSLGDDMDQDEQYNPIDTKFAQCSHLTNIMGYNIPTSTLYFIIVMIIIAVGLYFLTSERKKPIKNENKDYQTHGGNSGSDKYEKQKKRDDD